MSGLAILENVRRYRTLASLCRQTAVSRPAQKWTLLEQAYEWERRAVSELEAYFSILSESSWRSLQDPYGLFHPSKHALFSATHTF
jgi:hypothetical protein